MTSKIRQARLAARLTQAEVAAAINRSGMWLCLAERGKVPVGSDEERNIFIAIERLSALRAQIEETKRTLVADLALPAATGGAVR